MSGQFCRRYHPSKINIPTWKRKDRQLTKKRIINIKFSDKQIKRKDRMMGTGIGFGKTVEHNLSLMGHLSQFKALDVPIMIGPSRKAFLRNILKDKNLEDIQPDLPVVETGTQAAVAASALNGAHIIRVHNVANTRATLKIIDAIKKASSD